MINLKKWITNDRGGLFLDEGGGGDVARKTREFFFTPPPWFLPPPLPWVGDFRWRVKGRGRGEFFAEFSTNEKAANH